ncbi:hypothetical protein D3C86_1833120 [compost metagenome]
MPGYSGNGFVINCLTLASGAAAAGPATIRHDTSRLAARDTTVFMASLQVGFIESERLVR